MTRETTYPLQRDDYDYGGLNAQAWPTVDEHHHTTMRLWGGPARSLLGMLAGARTLSDCFRHDTDGVFVQRVVRRRRVEQATARRRAARAER